MVWLIGKCGRMVYELFKQITEKWKGRLFTLIREKKEKIQFTKTQQAVMIMLSKKVGIKIRIFFPYVY